MNVMAKPSSENLPSTARSDRIYAIGDIHGRYDLLLTLLDEIRDFDAGLKSSKSTHMIFLGDMIDRGPRSAAVLELLFTLSRMQKVTVLLGNHEELMLRAIDGEPGTMRAWLRLGGRATLRSFGVEPPEGVFDRATLTRAINKAIPKELLSWLRTLPLSARSGDYFFCHAGIRPGIDINRQRKEDLLWIRDEFLDSDESHGAVIVHGHSISPDVEVRHNRIGIDTGAYRTDMLTTVYLEGRKCGIISTGEPPQSGDRPLAIQGAGLAG